MTTGALVLCCAEVNEESGLAVSEGCWAAAQRAARSTMKNPAPVFFNTLFMLFLLMADLSVKAREVSAPVGVGHRPCVAVSWRHSGYADELAQDVREAADRSQQERDRQRPGGRVGGQPGKCGIGIK
jgi:hypothetical protein